MYFLFDANMPIRLARAIEVLDLDNPLGKKLVNQIHHISQHIDDKSPDTDVVRLAKKLNAIIVSQDDDYKSISATYELVKNLKVGYVLFKPPKKTGCSFEEIIIAFISAWPKLKEAVRGARRPFMFVIDSDGKVYNDGKFKR